MREGWTHKKLGDICKVIMGQSPEGNSVNSSKGIEFHQGKVFFGEKYLNKSHFFTEEPSKIAEPNSILLCVRAPVGTVNITPRRVCIGRGLCAIQASDIIAMPYLFYALTQKQVYYDKNSTGSTFKAISSKVVINTDIPLPPLSEQQHIVKELDLLSGIIEKKKKQLNELDNLAQSVFYDMFGDPITNEKGWEVKKLGEVCAIASSLIDPNQEPYCNQYHVSPANIKSGTGEIFGCNLAKDDMLISGKYTFDKGMILYSKIRPNLNKVAIAPFAGVCSADMYPLSVKYNVNNVYICQLLLREHFLEYASKESGRARMPKINRESLFAYEFPLPPLSLQQSFAEKIEAIEKQKELIKQSIKETETLFNSRMDYYFN